MKKLTYARTHHLSKLSDELIAAFPAWIKMNPDGSREALFSLSGDGLQITFWVPDTQDEAAVGVVVAAHSASPAPPVFDPNATLKAKIDLVVADTLIPQTVKGVLAEWKKRL